MKKYSILLAIIALVSASLACQTIMGGGDIDQTESLPPFQYSDDTPAATSESSDDSSDPGFSLSGESEFPVTSDAFNVVGSPDAVTFQTKLSADDVLKFYRDEFAKQGYTEDTSMALVFGQAFTMVFTGHESGKSIYVVGADGGDGSIYVTITLG